MNRDVEFDENAVCDICGKKGAFDFMGDYICPDCIEVDEDGKTSVKNPKERNMTAKQKPIEVLNKEDGCWLRFRASNRQEACINLSLLANGKLNIIKSALLQWIEDGITKKEKHDSEKR